MHGSLSICAGEPSAVRRRQAGPPRYADQVPTGRDDDALRWDGDDDPTLDVGAEPGAVPEPAGAPAATAALPEGWNAVGRGSETVDRDADADLDVRPEAADTGDTGESRVREPMGNAELIALGVLGGFSLLYAVGWLIGGLRLQDVPRLEYLVTDVMYQGALWLAVMAPLLWFVTVMVVARRGRSWVRFAWLVAGVVLLLPWPFVMIGAVGQ
jgi:hypothetical protein